MTLKQLAGMLKETKIPFAYDHFAEGESPQPPFICYLLPGSVNFAADGEVLPKGGIYYFYRVPGGVYE